MNQAAIDTLRLQPVPDQGLLIDGQTVPALAGETLAVELEQFGTEGLVFHM